MVLDDHATPSVLGKKLSSLDLPRPEQLSSHIENRNDEVHEPARGPREIRHSGIVVIIEGIAGKRAEPALGGVICLALPFSGSGGAGDVVGLVGHLYLLGESSAQLVGEVANALNDLFKRKVGGVDNDSVLGRSQRRRLTIRVIIVASLKIS